MSRFTVIALVLDVGKLAYPFGSRVALVTFMMLGRVATVAVLSAGLTVRERQTLRVAPPAGTFHGAASAGLAAGTPHAKQLEL